MESFTFSLVSFLPSLVFWALLALAAFRYAAVIVDSRQKQETSKRTLYTRLSSLVSIRALARTAVWFRIAYAAALTVLQYYIWSQAPLTRLLLGTPLKPESSVGIARDLPWLFDTRIGYFLFYSWGRFWLSAILSVGVALAFWWFLRALQRHNGGFFLPGETDIGLLTALLVGWPNVVVFLPLVFLGVVVVSLARLIVFRERLTTLGWPLLAAAAATLIWGSRLVEFLRLTVLRV